MRELPTAFDEMRVLGRDKHHGECREVCEEFRDLTTRDLIKSPEQVQGGKGVAQSNNRYQEASVLAVRRLDPMTMLVVSKAKPLSQAATMS